MNKIVKLIAEITDRARSWTGAPFKHQGRRKDGCDCMAIPIDVGLMLGMTVRDWTRYGRLPLGSKLYKSFAEHLLEIPKSSYEPGDVLLMTWKTEPHHTAIVVKMADGNIGIVHCHSDVGRVVEHRLDDKWRRRIVYAFRYPAVEKLNNMKDSN